MTPPSRNSEVMGPPTEPAGSEAWAAIRRFPWLHILWFGALLVLCYAPVIANITGQWYHSNDMVHGFFVPVIAGYIIWDKRKELFAMPAAFNRWGLAVILFGALLAWLGSIAAEIFTQRIALLVSLYGLVLYFAGTRLTRMLAFPLVLLLFSLPIPGVVYKSITFPLQLIATRVAELMLDVAGFTVLREGNILELAGHQVSVVEACSGIRSLLSLSFFSVTYAYLFHPKAWMGWLMLAVTAPVAVLANAFRVALTGALGEYNREFAEGFYHGFSGWLIFLIAIGALMMIQKLIARWAK